jgi:RecA/RadA recombinase
MTAHEYGQIRKKVIKISTGSKQLDAILGGYDDFHSKLNGGQIDTRIVVSKA